MSATDNGAGEERDAGPSLAEFSRQVASMNLRVDSLRAHLGLSPDDRGSLTDEAFEALGTTMEELRVAEEELRRRNDELTASRAAIEAEARRYRDLFDHAPDANLVTDPLGVIREANLAAAVLLGVERRFLLGKPLALFVPEEGRPGFRVELSRPAPPGRARQYEMSIRPRGLAPFHGAVSVYAELDVHNRPVALRWTIRDVTARKRADEQIRQLNAELQQHALDRTAQLDAEMIAHERLLIQAHSAAAGSGTAGQFFHDLVQDLDAIVWKADAATGRYTFVSRQAEVLLGFPAASWIDDPDFWAARVHPEDREYAAARRRKAARDGEDCESEYRLVDGEGRATWFREGVRVLRDEDGRTCELRGLMVNISKRKKVERQLYAAKNELSAQVQDLSYLQDLGRRLAASQELQPVLQEILSAITSIQGAPMGWISLYDRDRDDLVPVASIGFDEGFLARVGRIGRGEGACGRVLATGERAVVEDVQAEPEHAPPVAVLAAGGIRAIYSVPLRTAKGDFLGTISSFFRERHRPPARQAQLVERYAAQAAEFLAGARLLGELRDAGRRKDEFLAALAHELRTPLAPIRSALEVLRLGSPETEAGIHARTVIERQVENLSRLVEDLMDASRLHYGKVALRTRPVEVGVAVRAAIESARPQIDARGHHVWATLPPEPLWIEVDPSRLEQVLTNLLTNATKYTEPGGCIGVTVGREGDFAAIRVRDSGLGIAPEMVRRAFDLFSQEGRTRGRAEGGLGIGLSLVRRLAEAHGGSVEAASAGPGLGSEFTVLLPLVAPGTAQPTREAGKTAARPRRILLVDDDRDATHMLARLLRSRGHEVRAAEDGPSAVESAREYAPEVVVMDIGLTGVDGIEVARRLRDLPNSRAMHLVALTGREGDADRRLTAEAGFRHHLVKPIAIEVLDRILEA